MFSHARVRALSTGPATYYVPPGCAEHIEAVRQGLSNLDGSEIPMNIVTVSPGEDVVLCPRPEKRIVVQAFATAHRVKSQGYRVVMSELKGLREEFQGKPREELMEARAEGTEIRKQTVTDLLVYTGDTLVDALVDLDFVFAAKMLIVEASFLPETLADAEDGAVAGGDAERQAIEKARAKGHIHLSELAALQDKFQNEAIVFIHMSAKYQVPQIVDAIAAAFSDETRRRVQLLPALEAFGVPGTGSICEFEAACSYPIDFGEGTRCKFL